MVTRAALRLPAARDTAVRRRTDADAGSNTRAAHQADTAIAGMWLFLATEILFFGGLFLVWFVLHELPGRLCPAARHTASPSARSTRPCC